MDPRTCPKCKSELPKSSHYFCPFCGEKLSEDAINPVVFPKPQVEPLETSTGFVGDRAGLPKISLALDKKLLLELLVVLAIIVAIFGIKLFVDFYYNPKVGIFDEFIESTESTISSNANGHVLTSNVQYRRGDFKNNTLRYYIPSEVDLYIEAYDLGWLSTSNEEFFGSVASGINVLGGPFAVFSMRDEGDVRQWGFVVRLVSDFPSDLALGEQWKLKVSDNVLIVATDEEILNLISRTHSGVVKNITRSAKFVTSLSHLPDEGQIMVTFLTYEGRRALEEIRDNVTNDSTKDIVNRILDFGSNEIVVE